MKKQVVLKIEKDLLDRFDVMAKKNHRNRTQELTRLIELAVEGIQAPINEVPTQPTTTQEDTFGVSDIVENEGISNYIESNRTLSFEELMERGIV